LKGASTLETIVKKFTYLFNKSVDGTTHFRNGLGGVLHVSHLPIVFRKWVTCWLIQWYLVLVGYMVHVGLHLF